MNLRKNAGMMLLVALIAAMAMPFSGTNAMEANPSTADIEGLTAYEEWILTNTHSLSEMADHQKLEHILNIRAGIEALAGYEAAVMQKISNMAETAKQIRTAMNQEEPESAINALQMDLMREYFELEDLGVTTQDRWDAAPEYWKEKAMKAKKSIEGKSTQQTSWNPSSGPYIHHVHQTDLALKRTALLTLPVFGLPGQELISIPILTWGWNQGSSTSAGVAFTDGKMGFESNVCLDSPTHHDSVDFDFQTKREILTGSGVMYYNYDKTYELNIQDFEECMSHKFMTKNVKSGYAGELTLKISNVVMN